MLERSIQGNLLLAFSSLIFEIETLNNPPKIFIGKKCYEVLGRKELYNPRCALYFFLKTRKNPKVVFCLLETDFEANYYEGEEGQENLTQEGQRTLQHLENLLINGQGDGQGRQNPNGE